MEASAGAATGTYAPLWFTANRYGLSSQRPQSGYLRAGIDLSRELGRHWRVDAGLDLAGAFGQAEAFTVQQAYVDIAWRRLRLSVGAKERPGFPLEKNGRLSGGMMVEGPNARPVPQVRGEIAEYADVPGTRGWLALKGHIAYGSFNDGDWQEDFVKPGGFYAKKVYYHSKSLMFRIGNRKKLPVELEFGLLMAAQFAGDQYRMNADGTSELVTDMPDGAKSFLKAFIPGNGGSDTPWGDQVNVEGNHLGSWNFALNGYAGQWKLRAYLEHFFDDHSQMFWQYGRWKDGQLGLEVTLPENRFVSCVVYEAMSTKDQTGPILYDEFVGGSLGCQISAKDNYYNNYCYQAWQHWGQGMGHPFLPGPLYNADHEITFRSNRVRSQHLGLEGRPTEEWSWRALVSFVRHWGTYDRPLDRQRKQFSSLWEATYSPAWAEGWSASAALGLDRGNYLGNSAGGMITLKKTGGLLP